MSPNGPIPSTDWETIVRNVPIISVDLVVRQGRSIVLGKRKNEPAEGEWFTPGGAVLKHEHLKEAVHRIAAEELGIEVTIEKQLGVYEHFWNEAELDDVDGKHYVRIGYLTSFEGGELRADEQHSAIELFEPPFDEIDSIRM